VTVKLCILSSNIYIYTILRILGLSYLSWLVIRAPQVTASALLTVGSRYL